MRHKSYAPEIDIRAFAAVGPASGFEEHWRAGAALDGWHVPVHAMLIHAWAQEYGHRGPELWSPKLSPHVSRLMREGCMYSPIGAPALSNTLGSVRSEVFSPEFLRAFQTGAWGEFALFGEAFRKNRIRPFAQTAPIKIYQGDRDDIVPEWSTRELVESLRAGGVKVDYEIVPGGGHAGIAFGGLVSMELRTNESLAWLREKLD
jgi:pimeloyl-ACP methyl ester carboxylesterase